MQSEDAHTRLAERSRQYRERMAEPVVHQHLHYYEAPEQPPLQYAPNGSLMVWDTAPRRNPWGWYIFLLAVCGPPGWAVLALVAVFMILRAIVRSF